MPIQLKNKKIQSCAVYAGILLLAGEFIITRFQFSLRDLRRISLPSGHLSD